MLFVSTEILRYGDVLDVSVSTEDGGKVMVVDARRQEINETGFYGWWWVVFWFPSVYSFPLLIISLSRISLSLSLSISTFSYLPFISYGLY